MSDSWSLNSLFAASSPVLVSSSDVESGAALVSTLQKQLDYKNLRMLPLMSYLLQLIAICQKTGPLVI